MALPVIPLVSLGLIICLAVYRFLIAPAFLSPLAKIPAAHWSAPFSRFWILSHRQKEDDTPTLHAVHQRLGPIIRIAPNEISVNSVDGGIRSIYAGGYEKGDWYLNVFNNYGIMPMFAMPNHAPHSKRKRMLSNIYAKSTLQGSRALTTMSDELLNDRLVDQIRIATKDGQSVDFYYIFCAITLDFVSSYIFGLKNGTDLLRKPVESKKFFTDYKARQRFQFWPQDMPVLTRFLKRTNLLWLVIPDRVSKANGDIEGMILSMCDKAESTMKGIADDDGSCKPQDYPTVYAQLRNALLKENTTKSAADVSADQLVQGARLEVASEMLDHTLAGFDTSSIALTFLAWELSRPETLQWQDKLRQELAALTEKERNDAKTIDSLPILHAILMENLRLHASIPGNQPRITPDNATLGASPGPVATSLPAGVRVQAQAWSLHRNPDVFPNPESWDPSRWLESGYPTKEAYSQQMKEMNRWFWAFGSGGRMCVGSNLAMYDMKAIIATIWSRFRTTVEYDEGMIHRGGYVAEPIGKDGKYCVLKVEELST